MMQSMYNKKRGIFFIVAAAFNFSTMNMFARLAGDIPAMQKTFFRNLVAILVISTILLLRRQRITVKKAHLPALLARSLFGTLGVVCNFYAMDRMLLSDATILIDLSPFFVILVSSLLLHEKAKTVCADFPCAGRRVLRYQTYGKYFQQRCSACGAWLRRLQRYRIRHAASFVQAGGGWDHDRFFLLSLFLCRMPAVNAPASVAFDGAAVYPPVGRCGFRLSGPVFCNGGISLCARLRDIHI